MGSKRSWYIILVMFFVSRLPFIQAMNSHNPDSLDDFVHDYAYKAIKKPHTGILYNISLPANFSGIEVSFVRLRSASFWVRGANFSSFDIPPRIIPMPAPKRLDMVYQNLGNWSSYYYNVPNYTFVTPVVGFMTYDAMISTARDNAVLELSIMGDPISIRFPRIPETEGRRNVTMKCVRFGTDGSVELSDMAMQNVCIAKGQGHFAVVVPSAAPSKQKDRFSKKKERFWKWWVIGFGVGIVGLVLVVLVGLLVYKLIRKKRIREMERQSQMSEALKTVWVGMSKMPSATWIRTQPVLENEYIP
ncbi:uncharacterized protein LOC132300921 [Cornus florida]|uniref:uncharacterized protein LOC132300921 n=1 Tax=Cornus florida TaxID=4283 RepID=UPI0028983392|nr:uncharacterized protein LOC132300921 [Cornus florida]